MLQISCLLMLTVFVSSLIPQLANPYFVEEKIELEIDVDGETKSKLTGDFLASIVSIDKNDNHRFYYVASVGYIQNLLNQLFVVPPDRPPCLS